MAKKQMYSEHHKQAKKPAHGDHKSKKGFGPHEASKQKQVKGIAKHKGEDGPSEMHNKMQHGKPHKGITGPNEMSKGEKHGAHDKPARTTAIDIVEKGEHHQHTLNYMSTDDLRKGHKSLEKVPHDKAMNPPGHHKVKESKDDME